MVSHGSVEHACELEEKADYRRDIAALFIVRDVRYRPKWSLEIERVCEAAIDDLPSDLSPRMAGWLEALRAKL
jgi:hypothetical protein